MLPFNLDIKVAKSAAARCIINYILDCDSELQDYYENLEVNEVPKESCVVYQSCLYLCLEAIADNRINNHLDGVVKVLVGYEVKELTFTTEAEEASNYDLHVDSEARIMEMLISEEPCDIGDVVFYVPSIPS